MNWFWIFLITSHVVCALGGALVVLLVEHGREFEHWLEDLHAAEHARKQAQVEQLLAGIETSIPLEREELRAKLLKMSDEELRAFQ